VPELGLLSMSADEPHGYAVTLVQSGLQRAASITIQRAAEVLLRRGSTDRMADQLVSFGDREQIVDREAYIKLIEAYASGQRMDQR
jgi:hypothetical protein